MTRSKLILVIICIALAVGWMAFFRAPCKVVKSIYVTLRSSPFPDHGIVINDKRAFTEFLESLKAGAMTGVPEWLQLWQPKPDETLVAYPNATITGTAPFHSSLFIVTVKEMSKPGIGVAILKGNVNKSIKFTD